MLTVGETLNLIKQKTESEVKNLYGLEFAEIGKIIENFRVNLNEPLLSEINYYRGIEAREAQIFALIKDGYNLEEIAEQTMLSRYLIRKFFKKFLAKII